MTLSEVKFTLQTLVRSIPALAEVQALVLVDDGAQDAVMEAGLRETGLAILVYRSHSKDPVDQTRAVAIIDYIATVWVRTNPKVKAAGVSRWDPEKIIEALIPKALAYGGPSVPHFRFVESEPDYSDEGNNSQLIRFQTTLLFKP